MQLEKNQLEAIRYRVSKAGKSVTNDEIRKAAENFDNFDADSIAQWLISGSQITESLKDISLFNSDLPKQEKNALTISDKQALVKIQASQMGITLSNSEILTIIDKDEIVETESINYLLRVREIISDFVAERNQELQATTQDIIRDIGKIINDGNSNKSLIINNANQALKDIVEQCRQQATDYKSPYADRLESLRETLALRKK